MRYLAIVFLLAGCADNPFTAEAKAPTAIEAQCSVEHGQIIQRVFDHNRGVGEECIH